ncbi:transglycosylase domain-containing protein [Paenibacillus sediminis]|uniref:Penicillin-binding protein n=1 Tax=Paenibacillus sediminis TaxID=664909 RepID=A0ABS4GZ43_9BACL|nr:transglycosylase domain-containing protein [Paenibacillus sediminis]MBP1935540.1 penicillin-binding protein [Paenibacillus sediminis]
MDEEKNTKPEQRAPRKKKTGRRVLSVVKWLFIIGFTGILLLGGSVIGYMASILKDEPVRSRAVIEQKINTNAITGFAYFRDGTPIGQLRTEEDRRLVNFKDIPSSVIDAVLAIEDNDFYHHIGVDFKGTMRAVKQRLFHESVQTGGSTLTQQLARRVFLNLDKTDNRKVKEIFLALRLERFLSKDEILTAYLNKVPFGNGSTGYNVYGIKAAAKGIFGIDDLNKLNIAQSAYLAGLPQLPSSYSAFNGKGEFSEKGFNRAIKRQHLVLDRMLEEGKITQQQYNEALAFDIKGSLAKPSQKAYATYPYLMIETEREASEMIAMSENKSLTKENISDVENAAFLEEAHQQLLTGGYRVYTTIDKKVYNAMHDVAENKDNFSKDSDTKGVEQTAAMMIDHKTGAILGMIEGRDFNKEQMNYATQMVRQPGSTMKPIAAYLPALEEGLIQPASILDDSPIILKDYQKGFHIPVNANNRYQGLVTARKALNESLNIPALKLFNNIVTIDKAWAFARKLGITTIQPEDYEAKTGVLGGLKYGVTVEELTNAYGSIPNQGVFNDAYMIEKIVDSKGNIVYTHEPDPQRVYSEQTAYLMTDMLRTVITDGTGKSIKTEFKQYGKIPISGKTGSTQNYGDVWFMGFTPDVTLGVWAGYEQPINTLNKDARGRARSIWALIMNEVTEKSPELFTTKAFKQPDGIVKMTVSGYSGKKPTELTDKLVTDIFNQKYVPTEPDDGIIQAKYITYEGVNYIPNEKTPLDMVKEQVVVKREKPIGQLVKELEEAFSQMKGDHKPISYYMPEDAGVDAPIEPDPRVDDGQVPSAPTNVKLENKGGAVIITFNSNAEKDVVGYRLYRSLNGGAFQNQGSPILTGDKTQFKSYISDGNSYDYYITAVDVVGNESTPSQIVNYGSSYVPITPEIPIDNGSSDGDVTTIPSSPVQVTAKSSDFGVQLNWEANNETEKVTSYNIYYSDSQDGPFSKIDSSPAAQFDYTTMTPVKGWFYITAVNAAGESTPSKAIYYETR